MPITAIGSANLKASERRCCLERNGTNRPGMLPREVNDLLDLVTIETIIEGNGQSGGKLDTFECSYRFFTDIPQVFASQLDNVLGACAIELQVDGGEAPFDELFGEVGFTRQTDTITDHL